jgi:predicted ATPase
LSRGSRFQRPDHHRFEDSLAFERLHEQIYRDLGFQLLDVPAGPLRRRVTLIEKSLRAMAGQVKPA